MTVCTSCDTDGKYYAGDTGTEIIVDTCSDITTATTADLLVEKPDGTVETWSGSVYDTTKIRYIVQSGDFDQAGEYFLQAYVVMPGGTWRGNTTSFRVVAVFS